MPVLWHPTIIGPVEGRSRPGFVQPTAHVRREGPENRFLAGPGERRSIGFTEPAVRARSLPGRPGAVPGGRSRDALRRRSTPIGLRPFSRRPSDSLGIGPLSPESPGLPLMSRPHGRSLPFGPGPPWVLPRRRRNRPPRPGGDRGERFAGLRSRRPRNRGTTPASPRRDYHLARRESCPSGASTPIDGPCCNKPCVSWGNFCRYLPPLRLPIFCCLNALCEIEI